MTKYFLQVVQWLFPEREADLFIHKKTTPTEQVCAEAECSPEASRSGSGDQGCRGPRLSCALRRHRPLSWPDGLPSAAQTGSTRKVFIPTQLAQTVVLIKKTRTGQTLQNSKEWETLPVVDTALAYSGAVAFTLGTGTSFEHLPVSPAAHRVAPCLSASRSGLPREVLFEGRVSLPQHGVKGGFFSFLRVDTEAPELKCEHLSVQKLLR